MGQLTQGYKKTMSGSVGAGMKSLFGGTGRRFFVLEHKVTSKYHKAGEEQQIIVDQVEIGRDPNCAVRLIGKDPNDRMFSIVSRRHAAIQKEGDNWVLVHLSNTNSTFLNGKKFNHTGQKWYLQNGDEIQIAENGPKLCFKIPAGDRGLVKSIGLTARMSLFRQQALRPYKTAIASLACVLLLASCVGGYVLYDQRTIIIDQGDQIDKQAMEINSLHNQLVAQNEELTTQIEEQKRINEQERIENARRAEEDRQRYSREIAEAKRQTAQAIAAAERRLINQGISNHSGISALLEQQQIYKDVYFLFTKKVVLIDGNGNESVITTNNGNVYRWSGTGFLLSDGKFVTARHCIEGWWYQDWTKDNLFARAAIHAATSSSHRMKAYFTAISSLSNIQFDFTSDDFEINHHLDQRKAIGLDENGNQLYWNFTWPAIEEFDPKMWATDWAYTTKTSDQKGNLIADFELSQNLMPMQDLVVIGFPKGLGINDGNNAVEPISNSVKTSRRGLANNGCIMHSRGTDHGNSGGPIFAIKDGKLVVVAIVSRGDSQSEEYNWAVPISSIQ